MPDSRVRLYAARFTVPAGVDAAYVRESLWRWIATHPLLREISKPEKGEGIWRGQEPQSGARALFHPESDGSTLIDLRHPDRDDPRLQWQVYAALRPAEQDFVLETFLERTGSARTTPPLGVPRFVRDLWGAGCLHDVEPLTTAGRLVLSPDEGADLLHLIRSSQRHLPVVATLPSFETTPITAEDLDNALVGLAHVAHIRDQAAATLLTTFAERDADVLIFGDPLRPQALMAAAEHGQILADSKRWLGRLKTQVGAYLAGVSIREHADQAHSA